MVDASVQQMSATRNVVFCFLVADKKASEIFGEEAEGKPLREPGKITVSFTPRAFPTAARESTAPEEEEVRRAALLLRPIPSRGSIL